MSDFVKVGSINAFPEGRTHAVKIGDAEVCLARTGETVTAFPDSCTHAHALLSGCAIVGGQVTCPLHGAKFDVATGAATQLPATEPLLLHDVKVENGEVFIRLADDD